MVLLSHMAEEFFCYNERSVVGRGFVFGYF